MKYRCAAFFLWTASLFAGSFVHAQDFANSYAIVIGIDNYRDQPHLAYAVKDAQAMAAYLRTQAYTVIELYDHSATKNSILQAMQNTLAPKLRDQDRVLVFFAGHGYTEVLGGIERGYIIPFDGAKQSAGYISMDELVTLSSYMGRARHQLFIMDSCYSGLLATRGSKISPDTPGYISEIAKRPARQVLTAGGKDQQIQDGGPNGLSFFMGYLMEALQKGYADLDGDGYITFNELATYLIPRASNSYETPAASTLPGHGAGEYLFRVPGKKTTDLSSGNSQAYTGSFRGANGTSTSSGAPKHSLESSPASGTGEVPGDEFLQGQIAAISGNFEEAALHIGHAAEAGNADAMNRLGYLYAEGLGVARDYEQARLWYEKAASKGNLNSMVDLGMLYANGQGGKQDLTQALRWYRKAAAAGNAVAMHNLGFLYETGLGVDQSYAQARHWYDQCADLGYSECMKNIGIMYQLGTGVKQDLAQTRAWYVKAAAAGNGAAMNNLGVFYANGDGVKQDFQQAIDWYKKGIDTGNADAMFNLGFLYANGEGVEQDYVKAREWYQKAAEGGSNVAMQNLGALYGQGLGGPQDIAEGLRWMAKAAAAGNKEAQEFLKNLPK